MADEKRNRVMVDFSKPEVHGGVTYVPVIIHATGLLPIDQADTLADYALTVLDGIDEPVEP